MRVCDNGKLKVIKHKYVCTYMCIYVFMHVLLCNDIEPGKPVNSYFNFLRKFPIPVPSLPRVTSDKNILYTRRGGI